MDRQVPRQLEFVSVDIRDAPAPERDLGIRVHVEEVRGLQVRVALRLARVDARGGDPDVHVGLRDVVVVHADGAADVGEPAFDGRNHQVPYRELHVGVRGVDRPGREAGGGGCGRGARAHGMSSSCRACASSASYQCF